MLKEKKKGVIRILKMQLKVRLFCQGPVLITEEIDQETQSEKIEFSGPQSKFVDSFTNNINQGNIGEGNDGSRDEIQRQRGSSLQGQGVMGGMKDIGVDLDSTKVTQESLGEDSQGCVLKEGQISRELGLQAGQQQFTEAMEDNQTLESLQKPKKRVSLKPLATFENSQINLDELEFDDASKVFENNFKRRYEQ